MKPPATADLSRARLHALHKATKGPACGSGLSELQMAPSCLGATILFASPAKAITSLLVAPGTLALAEIAVLAKQTG